MRFWPFRRQPDPFDLALDTHIDGDFSMFACGENPPSEATIVAFEKSIGFRLPEDFRLLSRSCIGGI